MRVALTTLGCRLNQFETEAMGRRLATQSGADVVSWEQDADVYVVNSCTVTARADQKCRQLARSAKRRSPEARVVVVGCYPQNSSEDLRSVDEIDVLLGNEEKKRLDTFLPRILSERFVEVGDFSKGMVAAEEWIDTFQGHSRATIKVQEGCNMRCTFCSIWSARGPSRSRRPRDVVEQAVRLGNAGYEEIVLAGVHLGHFGRDLHPRTSLSDLLSMLLEVVDPRVRFRLSSIDPGEVDGTLARRLASEPRLCRYLHLPLQSGSNAILRRMRRPYSREYYRDLVQEIAAADPRFGLGIDVIVGFPGEGPAEFDQTLDLLELLPISFYHVFPYSDRAATPAAAMGDKVEPREIAARARQLRALGEQKKQAFLQTNVGIEVEGVVEAQSTAGEFSELMLDNYALCQARLPLGLTRRRVRVVPEKIGPAGTLIGRPVPNDFAVSPEPTNGSTEVTS